MSQLESIWFIDNKVRLPMKNHLRVLRATRGWSQERLAEQLEVSRQTINSIETGRYNPSLPMAFKIAAVFDLTIEEIFKPET